MSECKHCHMGEIVVPSGKMYGECDACGAFELLYEPQDYQLAFHQDTHLIRGLFGGLTLPCSCPR